MPAAKKPTKKKPKSNPAADPTIHAICDSLKIVGKSEWKDRHVRTQSIWISPKWKAGVQSYTDVELLVVSPKTTWTFPGGDKEYTNRLSLVMFTVGTSLFVAYALVSVAYGHKLANRPLLVVDTSDPTSLTTLAKKLLPLGLRLQE